MKNMVSRDEQTAPTLRSAEVRLAIEAASGSPVDGVASPRPRYRSAPEIAVVDAPRRPRPVFSEPPRPAWPSPGASVLGEVVREVATTLLEIAIGKALGSALRVGHTAGPRAF